MVKKKRIDIAGRKVEKFGRGLERVAKKLGRGRPKGSYKYRNPATGKPISVSKYKKLMRKARQRARTVETRAELRQRMALARRGLNPEEARQIQLQQALRAIQQQRMAQNVPIQARRPVMYPSQRFYPPQTIGRWGYPQPTPQISMERDLMSGRMMLKPINQQREAWLR